MFKLEYITDNEEDEKAAVSKSKAVEPLLWYIIQILNLQKLSTVNVRPKDRLKNVVKGIILGYSTFYILILYIPLNLSNFQEDVFRLISLIG